MKCKLSMSTSFCFSLIYIVPLSYAYRIVWDNDVEIDLNEIYDDYTRSDERAIPNRFFIVPGTKWCGAGNTADNDTDLGEQRDTDKCCRAHDMCPDIIEGYQTKYELTNPSFYTRLNCACDKDFYKCLKSVNTKFSTHLGQIYFTVLGTQCYKNDNPISGCKKFTSFPRKKCVEYEFDRTQPKIYQWFDLPNF